MFDNVESTLETLMKAIQESINVWQFIDDTGNEVTDTLIHARTYLSRK